MIYIDSEFKCHADNLDGSLRQVETSFFDGKCKTFIEGYRFVPPGDIWTSNDGIVFRGGMTAPYKPYSELAAAQAQYELDLAEAALAYQEGVDSAWT